jgi:acyl-CoA synthetase (AMP-forming)/AMP-acid ligase II
MGVTPTWRHDERRAYPGLHDQPSIEALFESVARREGTVDRVTVVDGDVRLTGGEMTARCARLAGGLRARGVRRGDVVVFQTPSWWETIALYRACWRLGSVATPIHHLAAEADVAAMTAQVEPRAVLAAARAASR